MVVLLNLHPLLMFTFIKSAKRNKKPFLNLGRAMRTR